VGLWTIVLAVTLGVPAIVHHFGGEIGSIYSGTGQAPRWFIFVMATIVIAEGFGPHVAHGLTRRTMITQSIAGFAVVSAVFGLASLAVTRVEAWFYAEHGWQLTTVYGQHPVPTEPWPLVALDHAVLIAVFAFSGLAVRAVYVRWRGWIGTLALPLTVGPVLLASAALPHVDSTDLSAVLSLDDLPYVAGLAIALAVAAFFAAVAHLTLR